jgi:hypothetical protein
MRCFTLWISVHVPPFYRPFKRRFLTSIHAQHVKCGTGGKGEQSTSRVVHCRLVLPAAMAGVRWRSRCAISLPPRARGCTSATRSDAWGRDIRVSLLATIPGELRVVEPGGPWPRCDAPMLPLHDGRSDPPAR